MLFKCLDIIDAGGGKREYRLATWVPKESNEALFRLGKTYNLNLAEHVATLNVAAVPDEETRTLLVEWFKTAPEGRAAFGEIVLALGLHITPDAEWIARVQTATDGLKPSKSHGGGKS